MEDYVRDKLLVAMEAVTRHDEEEAVLAISEAIAMMGTLTPAS